MEINKKCLMVVKDNSSCESFFFLRIRERRELRMESEWNGGKKKEKKVKEGNIILMRGGNKKHYLILAFNYSAHPYIAMHCSNVGKKFTYTTTIATLFFVYSGAKNNFLVF